MNVSRRLALGGGLATLSSAALAQSYLKRIGAAAPVNARGPAVFSTDAVTYGAFHKQQIPSIAKVGNRLFMVNYGGQLPFAEVSGEDSGCYARMMYSDDAIGPSMTMTAAAFWVPDVGTNSVQEPMVTALSNGSALVSYVFDGAGGFNRSARGRILTNPLADPAVWSWSRDIFIGEGFISPIRNINGSLHFSPYEPRANGCPFVRLDIADNILLPRTIGTVTDPPSAEIDYFEPSYVRLSNGNLAVLYRTEGRQYTCQSADGGRNWGPSSEFTLLDTISARCDWINLPNGLIALAYNESLTKREKLTLAILSGDGTTVIGKVVLDSRGSSGAESSYPNMCLDPTNSAVILVAWDCGRGNQDDEETNEIIVASVNIAAAMTSTLTMTSHTMTS